MCQLHAMTYSCAPRPASRGGRALAFIITSNRQGYFLGGGLKFYGVSAHCCIHTYRFTAFCKILRGRHYMYALGWDDYKSPIWGYCFLGGAYRFTRVFSHLGVFLSLCLGSYTRIKAVAQMGSLGIIFINSH